MFCLRTQRRCTGQGSNSRPSGLTSDTLTTEPPRLSQIGIMLRENSAVNPFTSDSATSKINKFSEITNWVNKQLHSNLSTAQQLSKEWSHFRVLYMESKVTTLCITQGFILEVKGLTNSSTVKYCSTAFQ